MWLLSQIHLKKELWRILVLLVGKCITWTWINVAIHISRWWIRTISASVHWCRVSTRPFLILLTNSTRSRANRGVIPIRPLAITWQNYARCPIPKNRVLKKESVAFFQGIFWALCRHPTWNENYCTDSKIRFVTSSCQTHPNVVLKTTQGTSCMKCWYCPSLLHASLNRELC